MIPRMTLRFRPAEQLRAAADQALADHTRRIGARVPVAEVEEMGATAVPGALTKGDLDLLVRVPADEFQPAISALRDAYAEHQRENWSPTFASFIAPDLADPLPVGIQLVVAGSDDDREFTGFRDLLRRRPDLVDRVNRLKRSFEGGDPEAYWIAKQELIEVILAEELDA
jgi:GrpB-like predicted nucleotidyltransferase (UPF0157 family)